MYLVVQYIGVMILKLSYNKNSSDPVYYIQQGFRNGKKTSTRNIKRIGKHSELLAITDDPLAYAKEQVRIMNEQFTSQKIDTAVTVDFSEKVTASEDAVSRSLIQNIGYFHLQKIYSDLKIRTFMDKIQKDTHIDFSCDDVLRFLVFGRILDPRSKKGTFDRLENYYGAPKIGYHQILRMMDLLEDHSEEMLHHLYSASENVVPRDTSVCYYDCTNFYFETEKEDEDWIDPVTGEYTPGLRKYGYSKQHKPNPLVEMGLFMDRSGIPVSMCIHPGNKAECQTAIPLEREVLKMRDGKAVIYCADAGLSTYSIRNFNQMGGRRFVVTQSLKKLSGPLQVAVFNDLDYTDLAGGANRSLKAFREDPLKDVIEKGWYDSLIVKEIPDVRMIDMGLEETLLTGSGSGKAKGTLKQRLIVTFSRKAMEYQRAVRNRQVERAKELMTKDPETVKRGSNDVRRFLKRKNSKEAITYELDMDKIHEEEKYDGFYALATNLEDDAATVIGINERRFKIEECFRIMKTSFRSRPVWHRKEDRIRAHFLICYMALLIFRLLEVQLDQKQMKVPEIERRFFTTEEILETLRNMNVSNFKDLFYQATYKGGGVLNALNDLQHLDLDRRYYQPKELRKKLREFSKER